MLSLDLTYKRAMKKQGGLLGESSCFFSVYYHSKGVKNEQE